MNQKGEEELAFNEYNQQYTGLQSPLVDASVTVGK